MAEPEGQPGDTTPTDAKANLARRSVSIFSRRGSERPESRPPFIVQGVIGHASRPKLDIQASRLSRSHSMLKGAKSAKELNEKSQQVARGTVLNAVPPAKVIHMTSLEEDMATLPNEEILSAISEASPTAYGHATPTQQTAPSRQSSFIGRRTMSMAQRTTSTKRRETNSRIGVWVDGVVHWDPKHRPQSTSLEETIEEETGLAPMSSAPVRDLATGRPHLSVIIPHSKPLLNAAPARHTYQPQSNTQRHMVPIAPAAVVSKFAIPARPSSSKDVSPMSANSAMPPPLPPRDPSHLGPPNATQRASQASSSAEESPSSDADDASDYSKPSSATSVEMANAASSAPKAKARPASAFSVLSPGRAGVFDESPGASCDTNKPLPPIPAVQAKRSMTVSPLASRVKEAQPVHATKSVKTLPDHNELASKAVRVSRSMTQLDLCDQEFMRSAPSSLDPPATASPTLSQAENELCRQLSTLTKSSDATIRTSAGKPKTASARVAKLASSSSSLSRSTSVHSVMHPPENAPAVPKRSRKREWRLSSRSKGAEDTDKPSRRRSEMQLKVTEPITALQRSASMQTAGPTPDLDGLARPPSQADDAQPAADTTTSTTTEANTDVPDISVDDVSSDSGSDVTEPNADEVVAAMSTSAEMVLLNILASLKSFEDLVNTAVINKGMYRVYKENEMYLLRCVAYNQSPASWEMREWSPPESSDVESSKASSQLDHTPLTYMRCFRRDLAVVENLKKLILERCQTVIRRETTFALSTPTHPNAQRFNDAIWRIWCFCKAFGSDKSREDDITGQLDWLKGGLLAHNQGCVATVNTNLDFDMSSVLLNAPDYFALGNAGGLTSGQLFDMTEIWTCMAALLQGYAHRVDDAQKYGIYDHCETELDAIEKQEQALEEWTSYLLTLGPAVVVEMAEAASESDAAGFELAKENGWTDWAEPQYSGSRTNFLKEPLARLYQERIAEEQQRLRDPRAQEKKELSRQRVANLAQEIRVRRQASSYKRLPLIDMAHERPMSMFSHAASVRSVRSVASTASRAPPLPTTPIVGNRISPIVEDRTETNYNPTQYNSFSPGIAQDTSERAVRKIVDMGFTPAEAREALRATDRGNGLRVDKAVEFLLANP